MIDIVEYHKTRTVLDINFILAVFDRQDRETLKMAEQEHPGSIIRSPHVDVIMGGGMKGLGGSVPANWNGSIYDWNGKPIKEKMLTD